LIKKGLLNPPANITPFSLQPSEVLQPAPPKFSTVKQLGTMRLFFGSGSQNTSSSNGPIQLDLVGLLTVIGLWNTTSAV
jgi:hypothetical protein